MKTEIGKQVTPLREAVILLNSLLPVCDLTEADVVCLEVSDDGNSEQALLHDIAGENGENGILDDFSASIQFNTVQVIPH